MAWASHAMYNDKLVAHKSVSDRLMNDFATQQQKETRTDNELLENPLMIIDTAGARMYEAVD